eukprot:jgi/Tetstr1/449650/TSEL_036718.t1
MAAPAPRISERNLGAVPETTASTYGSAIRPFLQFCAEQGVPPLGGTAATVASYIAWQGLRGAVKAASLQPNLSAINGFYRDHGAEPVAQGDFINKVRKGLAASQTEPDPPGVRTDVPARLITRALRLAETLLYYGQRGLPAVRWAVTHDEPAASWTSATVIDSLQLVAHMLEEHPPPGFVWTSHSLRKGAATAAYAIGVVLQKIKHSGGWAQLSSVVLDYINPTALPCAASWQLFGWLTPLDPSRPPTLPSTPCLVHAASAKQLPTDAALPAGLPSTPCLLPLPVEQREGVPHHLIDILPPDAEFSAGDFYDRGKQAVEDILKAWRTLLAGRSPLVVGGTSFYLQWFMYGKADTPKSTPQGEPAARAWLDTHVAPSKPTRRWGPRGNGHARSNAAQLMRFVAMAGVRGAGGRAGRECMRDEVFDCGVAMVRGAGDEASAQRLQESRNSFYRLMRVLEGCRMLSLAPLDIGKSKRYAYCEYRYW